MHSTLVAQAESLEHLSLFEGKVRSGDLIQQALIKLVENVIAHQF
jgi:hypothetical protein